jgi:hypothetical protein
MIILALLQVILPTRSPFTLSSPDGFGFTLSALDSQCPDPAAPDSRPLRPLMWTLVSISRIRWLNLPHPSSAKLVVCVRLNFLSSTFNRRGFRC